MPFPGISQLWLHIQTWQHMAISVFLNDNLNYFGIEQMLCLLTNHICHYHHECDKHILDITICPLHRPLTLRVSRVIMDHPLAVTFLLTFLLTFMNIRLGLRTSRVMFAYFLLISLVMVMWLHVHALPHHMFLLG